MRHWRKIELNNKGVEFENFDVNKLTKHPAEELRHFAVKSQLFFILRDMGHDVLTEFRIKWINNGNGFGIGDILDLSCHLPRHFEIENGSKKHQQEKINMYIRNGIDIQIVDINKLPEDEYQRYRHLRDVVVIED